MWGSIIHVDDEVNIVYFIGRSIAYILFVIWGFVIITKPLASNYVGMSFMHNRSTRQDISSSGPLVGL